MLCSSTWQAGDRNRNFARLYAYHVKSVLTLGRDCVEAYLSVMMSGTSKAPIKKSEDIKVFISHRDSKCDECGEELAQKNTQREEER